MITLYGIKNCDTVKKARNWLEDNAIEYRFHDVRTDGLTLKQVQAWITELHWENLVNKRSTSWKALDDKTKKAFNSTTAANTILQIPTLIKRPLLDNGHKRTVGFNSAHYEALLLG